MIKVTRLNGQQLAVNSDMIKFAETTPDTLLTLSTGDKLMVQESLDEIIERMLQFKRLSFSSVIGVLEI